MFRESKLRSLFFVLVAAVTLVLAAVTAYVGFTLHQSQVRYADEADRTARNLSLSLENALHAHFQEVDLTLQRAGVEFRRMHVEKRFSHEQFSAYLRSLKERLPQARSIRGTDAHGMVIYGEDIDPSKPLDLAVREFFQRVTVERELVFGIPVKSRVSGEMVFPLIYAMTHADGSFGGTAYVNMTNARISELISSLKLGPHDAIALIDTRHRLLYRFPAVEGATNGAPVKIAPETAAAITSGTNHASYMAVSGIDGEKRRYNIDRIGAYPVYIMVGKSERDYLAPWRGEVRNASAFLLVLFALVASLLAGVHMALQRQRRAVHDLLEKDNVLQTSMVALTQSEARFRSLTEGLPQMVWTTIDGVRFDFISHHWADFTGLSAQALTSELAFQAIVHEDDLAAMQAAAILAREGGGQFRCDCRMRRHDGVWRTFDNHGLPQRDADGSIVCWIGSSTDITAQREAHDALRQAKDQALAAGRAKSDFLANMSHEIRSPMNAVSGMLQLLQRTPMSPLQRDYASKAESSARALLGILNDILDFSKVEEGKLTLDPQPFSVDKLLRELAVILSANASGKGIEVLFSISPDLPQWLVGDELRLQQVLLNLAGNAVKFTQQGEVVLTVLPVRNDQDGVDVSLIVRDTGIGMSAASLPHIFDGFSQAEASTARRFGGTGLGLAISQRLVALMGGELRVSSELGKGSVFDFTIRLGHAKQHGEQVHSHQLQHLNCLVVDDNPTGRAVLAAIVRSFGWTADLAGNGYDALGAVARAAVVKPYDVVFLDWRMPGLDGWETSARLRQLLPEGKAPSIIMVTAHDRELVTEKGAQLAPVLDAMLSKPVTASVVFDTVAELRMEPRKVLPALPTVSGGRLGGLKLLVVDDNALNQQVARELLRADGAEVDVADSGSAAIHAVCTLPARYDLLLMDIQMPDMDGYATTAAIRERLGHQAPQIVAMTANALQSDRDAAHAAGMVDHVGKPFDLEQLVAVILRHTAGPSAFAAAAPERAALAVSELNAASALVRLGGNAEVYGMALRSFEGEIRRLSDDLAAAALADNAQQAAAALHVMKGVAGMIGADELAAMANTTEIQLKALGQRAAGWTSVKLVQQQVALAVQAAAAALDAHE